MEWAYSHAKHTGRRSRESGVPVAITVFDEAHSLSEERWFTLGTSSEGKLLAVAHTYQPAGSASVRVRIISAREASRSERGQYENGQYGQVT